jgi:hypothetical protein
MIGVEFYLHNILIARRSRSLFHAARFCYGRVAVELCCSTRDIHFDVNNL